MYISEIWGNLACTSAQIDKIIHVTCYEKGIIYV